MSDKQIILGMIDGFMDIEHIDSLPTSTILSLIKMRLEEPDRFQHYRDILDGV